jgi:hypothetical protein
MCGKRFMHPSPSTISFKLSGGIARAFEGDEGDVMLYGFYDYLSGEIGWYDG